jgi:hypothetical protein
MCYHDFVFVRYLVEALVCVPKQNIYDAELSEQTPMIRGAFGFGRKHPWPMFKSRPKTFLLLCCPVKPHKFLFFGAIKIMCKLTVSGTNVI